MFDVSINTNNVALESMQELVLEPECCSSSIYNSLYSPMNNYSKNKLYLQELATQYQCIQRFVTKPTDLELK